MTRTRASVLVGSLLLAIGACRDPDRRSPAAMTGTEVLPPVRPATLDLPDRPLVLGRPPHLSRLTEREYQPLAAHLAKAIGHPIEMRVPGSYGEVTDLLVAGEMDLALLTPLIYVQARERLPSLRLLATLLGEGAPRYRGYIVTELGTGIRSLEDLRGKRFAFVDSGSTSGYLFPVVLLREAGIDPARDFASTEFAGSHALVVKRILSGRVDAGAISSTTLAHLRAEGVPADLNIVAKTDWIPFDAFVAHPDLPEAVAQTIQHTLIGLSTRTAEGRSVLTGITTTNGFVFGDDRMYDTVRKVAKTLAEQGK